MLFNVVFAEVFLKVFPEYFNGAHLTGVRHLMVALLICLGLRRAPSPKKSPWARLLSTPSEVVTVGDVATVDEVHGVTLLPLGVNDAVLGIVAVLHVVAEEVGEDGKIEFVVGGILGFDAFLKVLGCEITAVLGVVAAKCTFHQGSFGWNNVLRSILAPFHHVTEDLGLEA